MNIMHQTQESENEKLKDNFTAVLVEELSELKSFILELEGRMTQAQQHDMQVQKEIRENFKEDVKTLATIEANQQKFIDSFVKMEKSNNEINKAFAFFSEVQLPNLDGVIYEHLEVLRGAEQGHYDKLRVLLEHTFKNQKIDVGDFKEMKQTLQDVENIAEKISSKITRQTIEKLSVITKTFENQIVFLKSHAETIQTSLSEDENRLLEIRKQIEVLLKQIRILADKMLELNNQGVRVDSVFVNVKEFVDELQKTIDDYIKAQVQLSLMAKDLQMAKDEQLIKMKEELEELSEKLSAKIDESLEKLHKHYHIASDDITRSVKLLAKKAQLQNGYGDLQS